jgi:hypothetical protein
MRRVVVLGIAMFAIRANAQLVVSSGPPLGYVVALGVTFPLLGTTVGQTFTVPLGSNFLTAMHFEQFPEGAAGIFPYSVTIRPWDEATNQMGAPIATVNTSNADPVTHAPLPMDYVFNANVVPGASYIAWLTAVPPGMFFPPCDVPPGCGNFIVMGFATPGVHNSDTGSGYGDPHPDVYVGGKFIFTGHPEIVNWDASFTASFITTPEPSTLALVAVGLIALALGALTARRVRNRAGI